MLSIIVIGRNENWKLTKCLTSIMKTVSINGLTDFEIIYVDSNSTDDSVERAQKFQGVAIYKLTGSCNAAIARNVGVLESSGEFLFFVDGDMEIVPSFIPLVYDEKRGLLYEYVSGQFVNYYYDPDGMFIKKEEYHKLKKDQTYCETTGGLFFIKRESWKAVRGMKNKYKKSQDLDLGLRLAYNGVKLLRLNKLLAKHNTVNYFAKQRVWKDFLHGYHLYGRSMLYREHILNRYIYKRILRYDYSLLVLVLSFAVSLSCKSPLPLLFYFLAVSVRSMAKRKLSLLLFFVFRDISVLLGLFLFFPLDIAKASIKYEVVDPAMK